MSVATKIRNDSRESSRKTQPRNLQASPILLAPKLEYGDVSTGVGSYLSKEQLPSNMLTLQPPSRAQRSYSPPMVNALVDWAVDQDSTPLQVWEGVVKEVDRDAQTMRVVLTPRMFIDESHTADIELQWVTEQDQDLVRPGAVFYLTLFKRTSRGSISNSQELRFRRLPSWTKSQIGEIDKQADLLLSKMRASPVAE